MTHQPLTIIIITNRNDRRFVYALKSAQFAEEVLIYDNNSGNNWLSLQKQFHFSILNFPDRIEDFAKIHNLALENAQHNWMFFLDSDEVISEDLQTEICNEITNQNIEGFYIKRRDIFLGKQLKYGETGRTSLLRLGQKNAGEWKGKVHETWDIKGQTATLHAELFHFPHTNIQEFLTKISGYSELRAGELQHNNKEFNTLQALIFPCAKFVQNYIFRLGFLDGFPGLVYAVIMSIHSASVRINLYEKQNRE